MDIQDFLLVLGVLAVAIGVGLIFIPAGVIVFGAACLWISGAVPASLKRRKAGSP